MHFDEIAQSRVRREVARDRFQSARGAWLVALALIVAVRGAAQQPPANPTTFRGESRTGQPADAPKPANVVTPEMRGDIFMAKKMYREAAEAYKEGPKNSAVMLNKTGIAYHQMLELNLAERYYRAAVKIDPHYSEAINNLGTIYYARKSYRRAVTEYKRALRINPKSASILSNLG